MLFATFSKTLLQLEQHSSRLEMTGILADLFKKLNEAEIIPASYLLQGGLVPAYQSLEFQLSAKMLIRSLAQLMPQADVAVDLFGESSSENKIQEVERLYKQIGDIGQTALAVREASASLTSARPSSMSLQEVFEDLLRIAQDSGQGSQERKVAALSSLLGRLDALSAKYVTRIVMGKMRLGFSVMTMIDALSWSIVGDKSHRGLLEDAYQKQADIGNLALFYLSNVTNKDTLDDVERTLKNQYKVVVGIPVVPALCQRLNTSAEIIEKMGKVIAEPKYDGLRVQIHIQKSSQGKPSTQVFTRSLEDVTYMFPEIDTLPQLLECESCILDGEAIGYDPVNDQLLPFQKTITRKRKHGVAEQSSEVPIRFYIYDVLLFEEEGQLDIPLSERKQLLKKIVTSGPSLELTPFIVTTDATQLHSFHEAELEKGLEGAVVKQFDSVYQSGRKGWSWVKIKESEGSSGKLSDTVDAVIMGYYLGKGSRAQFGIGAFLAGVIDTSTNDLQVVTLTKVGTGMTEAQLAELKARLANLEVSQQPKNYQVDKQHTPDIWVEPELVVELAADEITTSPSHTAGVALRFPRLVGIREDKALGDVTTLVELGGIRVG